MLILAQTSRCEQIALSSKHTMVYTFLLTVLAIPVLYYLVRFIGILLFIWTRLRNKTQLNNVALVDYIDDEAPAYQGQWRVMSEEEIHQLISADIDANGGHGRNIPKYELYATLVPDEPPLRVNRY